MCNIGKVHHPDSHGEDSIIVRVGQGVDRIRESESLTMSLSGALRSVPVDLVVRYWLVDGVVGNEGHVYEFVQEDICSCARDAWFEGPAMPAGRGWTCDSAGCSQLKRLLAM